MRYGSEFGDVIVRGKRIFEHDVEFRGNILGGNVGYHGQGDVYYVDPVNGNNGFRGKTPGTAKKSLEAAHSAMSANQHDTLYALGGATAFDPAAVLTWSKDYTHIIGVTAPTLSGGRVRIKNTGTAATTGEVVISATGCSFGNLHFQYGDSATATSVIGVSITGSGRLSFNNCSFEGPIDATVGAAAYRTLNIGTGVQDLDFFRCHFGQRTILATGAAGATVYFAGSNNTNNVFEDCVFNAYNSNTASCTIGFANNAMPDSGWTLFRTSTFINHVAANIANVIRFTTGAHGICMLDRCGLAGLGTLVWATNNKTTIFSTGPAGAATGGVGANPA